MTNENKKDTYEQLKEFVKNKQFDINENYGRNNRVDAEASWICHAIWETLINVPNTDVPEDYIIKNKLWGNEMVWEGQRFHFDIMNNPKSHNNRFSCGLFSKMDIKIKDECLSIYHNIGNMAPVPWFMPRGTNSINSQSLHASLDERWDLYLSVLRSFWSGWSMEWKVGFEEYMKKTCQQMYFCITISDSNDYNFDNIDEIPDDDFEKIIEGIDSKQIEKWDKSINKNTGLVSFSPGDNCELDKIGKRIKRLIQIRNVIIKEKLNQYMY